jgi:hypothetical protein
MRKNTTLKDRKSAFQTENACHNHNLLPTQHIKNAKPDTKTNTTDHHPKSPNTTAL